MTETIVLFEPSTPYLVVGFASQVMVYAICRSVLQRARTKIEAALYGEVSEVPAPALRDRINRALSARYRAQVILNILTLPSVIPLFFSPKTWAVTDIVLSLLMLGLFLLQIWLLGEGESLDDTSMRCPKCEKFIGNLEVFLFDSRLSRRQRVPGPVSISSAPHSRAGMYATPFAVHPSVRCCPLCGAEWE